MFIDLDFVSVAYLVTLGNFNTCYVSLYILSGLVYPIMAFYNPSWPCTSIFILYIPSAIVHSIWPCTSHHGFVHPIMALYSTSCTSYRGLVHLFWPCTSHNSIWPLTSYLTLYILSDFVNLIWPFTSHQGLVHPI